MGKCHLANFDDDDDDQEEDDNHNDDDDDHHDDYDDMDGYGLDNIWEESEMMPAASQQDLQSAEYQSVFISLSLPIFTFLPYSGFFRTNISLC